MFFNGRETGNEIREIFFVLLTCGFLIASAQTTDDTIETHDSDTKTLETAEVGDVDPKTNFNSDSEDKEWIRAAVVDTAYYLRAHKFGEFDRRFFVHDDENSTIKFYAQFPDPPLRTLHWEVKKFCSLGFVDCIRYLQDKIEKTELHRSDDTVYIMVDQNWTLPKDKSQVDKVDEECFKLHRLDWIGAQPFLGPLERFQWRTSASYFMCWFTMNKVKALAHFGEPCDNFSYCLDPWYGPFNSDVRANDKNPFSCAMYSFCPDPCCPQKHLQSWDECWDSELNLCYDDAPRNKKDCLVPQDKNKDLVSIILNRWNVSCRCDKRGFEWNSKFGICVDVNECTRKLHSCNELTEACINTRGGHLCICRWTFLYNETQKQCVRSQLLISAETGPEKKEKGKAKLIQRFLSYIVPDAIQGTEYYKNVFNGCQNKRNDWFQLLNLMSISLLIVCHALAFS